jgi:YD repeat-containing protein
MRRAAFAKLYCYDSNGNLLTSSRNVGGVNETTANAYDSHRQLLSTTDANNNTSSTT